MRQLLRHGAMRWQPWRLLRIADLKLAPIVGRPVAGPVFKGAAEVLPVLVAELFGYFIDFDSRLRQQLFGFLHAYRIRSIGNCSECYSIADSERSFARSDHEPVCHRQRADHQRDMGHHCRSACHCSDAGIKTLGCEISRYTVECRVINKVMHILTVSR